MSLVLFSGAAGTGKTTCLFREMRSRVERGLPGPDSRILALTRMHGSRRRLLRMASDSRLRVPIDCMTVDALARRVVTRFRAVANASMQCGVPEARDFAATCDLAAQLLDLSLVSEWIARTYPLVLIDEMQDSRGSQLRVLASLSRDCECLAAADPFQDLSGSGNCESLEWARGKGEVMVLTKCHRTNAPGLLSVARAIRDGGSAQSGAGFKMFAVRNHNVCASFMARNLTWYPNDVAVITPTGSRASRFIRRSFTRLSEGPFNKDGRSYGPFSPTWEQPLAAAVAEMEEALDLERLAECGEMLEIRRVADDAGLPELATWMDRRRRLTGVGVATRSELSEQVERLVARRRSLGSAWVRGARAMTVAQAKNREFKNVVVLWPVEVAGGEEAIRRRLYNAITRAKERVILLLQDPRGTRAREGVFAKLPLN